VQECRSAGSIIETPQTSGNRQPRGGNPVSPLDTEYLPRFRPPHSCSIPDDHISRRRSALFTARSVLRDIRDEVRPC
jgi:hypothetical protein